MNVIRHDDERFAEFLRGAVRGLDPSPDAVPRDAMWAAIAAQRHGRGGELDVPVIAFPADRSTRKLAPAWLSGGMPMRWAMPAALSLVAAGIVVGVMIGRGGRSTPLRAPASAQVAVAPPVLIAPPSVSAPAPSAPPVTSAEEPAADPFKTPTEIARPSALPRLKERGTAAQHVTPGFQGPLTVSTSPSTMGAQVVTTEYMVKTLDLFIAFELSGRKDLKKDPKATAENADVATKAAALLAATQILLDREGQDKQRVELLRNIELVLMQMAQLSPDQGAEDRELVKSAVTRVLPSLKLAVPATAPGGA